MTLSDFLTELSQSGVGVVTSDAPLRPGEGWQEVLRQWDVERRLDLALDPPTLSLRAGEWAAIRLYRGCQSLVCREMPAPEIQRFLAVPCPEAHSPSVDYSVDLVFRFLPDLVAFARRVAQGDPLVAELLQLARAWPLSSVGIAGVGEVDPSAFLGDPSLLQLYVDRILATHDTTRLHHDLVLPAVRMALGAFPELSPAVAAALSTAV